MRILMFGWEYPPLKSGGLGTACYGLTKAMASLGEQITFVLPRAQKSKFSEHMNLVSTESLRIKELEGEGHGKVKFTFIDSLLTPYQNTETYLDAFQKMKSMYRKMVHSDSDNESGGMYGKDLWEEVARFTAKAEVIARYEEFDLIVGHDWMTFEACFRAQAVSGKPVCLHIHAVEQDRAGSNHNKRIYELERWGLNKADMVVANSVITMRNCIEQYKVDPQKIVAVHLGVDQDTFVGPADAVSRDYRERYVVFFGRMTMQKGPEYFLRAAKIVLEHEPDVKFIMAGDGDMYPRMIEETAALGIAKNVFFTGFLNATESERLLKMCDVFVMPSVTEPFGIAALEAIQSGLACIVPKNAGVSEVLHNVLKVDFWDTHDMADKIISIIRHSSLQMDLVENAIPEVKKMTWENTAQKTIDVYRNLLSRKVGAYHG